jgi:hypothetical protein
MQYLSYLHIRDATRSILSNLTISNFSEEKGVEATKQKGEKRKRNPKPEDHKYL